jgi:hypothetical protein
MTEDLTTYDIKPEAFTNYLRYYGEHFNKKLCDFALSNLSKKDITKEKLELLLKTYSIELKNNKLYDAVYLANWCRSILYGSSIPDEKHLALFLKDIFDKEYKLIFNRWYADMAKQGIPIEWEDMI